jgi:hypothetical protein
LKDCALIQEQIAWDKELPEEIQLHVLSCEDCNRVATEFASLDSWIAQHLDASIPEGFADAVMARITSKPQRDFGVRWLPEASRRILSSRWMQVGIVAAGSVIAVLNLIRFVLSVILPVIA